MFYAKALRTVRWASRRGKGFKVFVFTQYKPVKGKPVVYHPFTEEERAHVNSLFTQLGIREWTVGGRTGYSRGNRFWNVIRVGHIFYIPRDAFEAARDAIVAAIPLPTELARRVVEWNTVPQVLLG